MFDVRCFPSTGCLALSLAVLSCSSGDDTASIGDGGITLGPPTITDAASTSDRMVVAAGTDTTLPTMTDAPGTSDGLVIPLGTDTAPPDADTTNCVPFSPPIPCAQGTACPGDAYCDLNQSPPICTKLHCRPVGAGCPTDGTGDDYCTSGICLAGRCTSPTGEGASCATVPCASGLHCLGYPPTCMKLQPIGGACQDDSWCAASATGEVVFCLSGVCGVSYCYATGTNASCGTSGFCDPGYACLKSTYSCAQLYCGKDGIPCDSDSHCTTGYGCVDSRCRKLNVAPHCAGTPSNAVCPVYDVGYVIVPGCTATVSTCSGTALSCSTHSAFGSQECTDQVGCQWDSSTSRCTGTPSPCSELTGSVGLRSCTSRYGCTGTKAFSGTPTPCNQLSTTDCPSQPGCKVTSVGVY
jgi:hypothetical protein